MIIRFGYCPPNPGHKAKPKCKWYRCEEISIAIQEYDGRSEIYINASGRYHQVSYSYLLKLEKKYEKNRVKSI